MPDSTEADDPKVQELRSLSEWSEGQVWCSPERHGTLTGVMKSQIDGLPLNIGSLKAYAGPDPRGHASLWRIAVVQCRERASPSRSVDAHGNDSESIFRREGVSGI